MSTYKPDTYSEVVLDHNNIKDLYHRYIQEKDDATKSSIVNTIIREIAVHSEAEEITVYNALESHGLNSDAEHCRDEHQALEEVLYDVDTTKLKDDSFRSKFETAVNLFIKHSDEEEEKVLKSLSSKLSKEEDTKLADSFVQARKLVPHRPHPLAPQSGGLVQKTLGTLTKPHDLIIEKLTGRKFVDLRFNRPITAPVQATKIDQALRKLVKLAKH